MDLSKTKHSSRVVSEQTSSIVDIVNSNQPAVQTDITQLIFTDGLSTNRANNTITSTGTVFLYADLNDLNNVNAGSPAQNQVLTYSGTSWKALSFDGLSIASFSQLSDTPHTMTNQQNKVLKVNTSGTCIVYSSEYLKSTYGGEGINTYSVESNNKQKIVFDSAKFDTTTTSSIDNKVLIRQSSGLNKLIRFDKINLNHLDNSGSCFVKFNTLSGGYGISYYIENSKAVFSFLPAAIPANNFNNASTGKLSILYGGTSATSISEAQTNLLLKPNVDILSRSGPSFRGQMYGVNINLMPDTFNLSLVFSGKGYSTSIPSQILKNPADLNDTFTLSVGFFNSGGSIGQIPSVLTGQMSNLHTDAITTYVLYGPQAGGTSATVQVTPEIQYLTFGPQTNGPSSAIGFRNNYGSMQFRASRTTAGASTWRSIFPLSMTGISEVNTGGFSTNNILIYTGTCFKPYNMKGHGTLTGQAVFSLNIPNNYITANKLNANGSTLTNAELGYLSGTTSNIQTQFAGKIGLSEAVAPASGDLIYYDGAGTCWRPLRAPTDGTSMIIYNNSAGKPEYDFPGNIFGVCGTSPSLLQARIGYFAPDTPGYRISVKQILTEATKINSGEAAGASSAIRVDSNGNMLVSYTNLTRGTSIATSDLISFQNSTDYISAITKENLAKTLAGEGLSASSGNIRFNYDGVSLPYYRLKNYTVSNVPSASGVSGKLIFVNNGDSGSPCLAVSYNNNWKRIALGSDISAS